MSYHVDHVRTTYMVAELECGYRNRTGSVQFNHRAYDQRAESARKRYDMLRADLEKQGMINPLITKNGGVLIGMRRFEIMRGMGQEVFECLEVTENMNLWTSKDVTRFQNWKTYLYGDSAPAC